VVNRQSDLMATYQANSSVALIDLRTLRPTATLPARDGSLASALVFLPDGRTLVTGGNTGYLTFWDTAAHTVTRRISLGEPVLYVDVSPDGQLLAAQTKAENATNAEVQVRPVTGGAPLWQHGIRDGTGGLNFSPDGREVAALGCCTSFSTVESWDTRSGVKLFRHRLPNQATAIAFVPHSQVLAVATQDGRVLFWNARTGAVASPSLQVSTGNIIEISFSPDGTVMAVASRDESTTLWDLRSGLQIGNSFPERPNVITAPVFEDDGSLLIEYLSDAAQWPMDVASWERFACQVAGQDMTPAEFHQILPTRPYVHVCP
jgi:WD40 repeat protein